MKSNLPGAALATCLVAGCGANGPGPSVPTQPSAPSGTAFECTQVVGFSQTNEWYAGGFEGVVDDSRWQLLWRSGANIDSWIDPVFEGWSQPIVSPCTRGATTPDRVVLTSSGVFQSEPAWWAAQIQAVVATMRAKDPRMRQILLQPVVGGPGHAECRFEADVVRASFNHPAINRAIAMVAAAVGADASPEVRSCAEYRDGLGHLAREAHRPMGESIGGFYAAFDAR